MDAQRVAKVAHALSDPTRLEVLKVLLDGRSAGFLSPEEVCCPGGVCVCDLESSTGLIQSKISYHLRELKDAGLVTEMRVGRWNYYTVVTDTIKEFAGAVESLTGWTGGKAPVTFHPRS